MAMKCITCSHPKRLEAERAYLQGVAVTKIAGDLGLNEGTVRFHMTNHLSRQLVKAFEQRELSTSMDMLGEIDQIIRQAKDIFNRNYRKGADVTALKALSEQRSTLELLCKISAFMHESKLLELQTRNEYDQHEAGELNQAALAVLTVPEMKMFLQLSDKINNQTRTIIIPEDPNPCAGVSAGPNNCTDEEPATVPSVVRRGRNNNIQVPTPDAVRVTKMPDSDVSTGDEPLSADDASRYPSWYKPGQKYVWINGIPQRPASSREEMQIKNWRFGPE